MRTKGILLASTNIAPRLISVLYANKVQDPELCAPPKEDTFLLK